MDVIETRHIRSVFGADAERVQRGSTKSMHGHAFGISGAIEAVATVLALKHGLLPPRLTSSNRTPNATSTWSLTRPAAQRLICSLEQFRLRWAQRRGRLSPPGSFVKFITTVGDGDSNVRLPERRNCTAHRKFEVLSVKYADLQKTLLEALKIEFTLAVGFQIPTASEAEFLSIESVIKFETELKMDEFLSGASILATRAFTGDDAEIATTATRVATLALKNVFSLGGFSFGGGYSERFDHTGKPYISPLCHPGGTVPTNRMGDPGILRRHVRVHGL